MTVLDTTFGAALVGLVVSACLFGITLMQTFSYFRNYPKDKAYIKWLVILLTVLDTLHLILCTRTIYWYLVSNFGNTDNLDRTSWSMALQTDCNGLIGIIVEVFFARRVWMSGYTPDYLLPSILIPRFAVSKNWLITAIIVVLACLHFGLGVVFTAESFILGRFSKFGVLTWETCLGLGSAAVADVMIAASMCYYLYKKRTGLKRSVRALSLLADGWV
ncbi:hypothetical protein GSI_15551 [Ganoderma sinense ZZ0214-1]|uniref:Uncharacterized protein n=1 Tax=Ganoderma sinense ZZ0214-1 TaxID=1077348 RepID=A0A2G8RMW9_9APHY|nr:hypothetical protein GSI_15551 [Ganoderma sinense ZZ0214-1]